MSRWPSLYASDLLRHELLHLTHCSSIGDLDAGEGRGQLLLRLGEGRVLALDLRGECHEPRRRQARNIVSN